MYIISVINPFLHSLSSCYGMRCRPIKQSWQMHNLTNSEWRPNINALSNSCRHCERAPITTKPNRTFAGVLRRIRKMAAEFPRFGQFPGFRNSATWKPHLFQKLMYKTFVTPENMKTTRNFTKLLDI